MKNSSPHWPKNGRFSSIFFKRVHICASAWKTPQKITSAPQNRISTQRTNPDLHTTPNPNLCQFQKKIGAFPPSGTKRGLSFKGCPLQVFILIGARMMLGEVSLESCVYFGRLSRGQDFAPIRHKSWTKTKIWPILEYDVNRNTFSTENKRLLVDSKIKVGVSFEIFV